MKAAHNISGAGIAPAHTAGDGNNSPTAGAFARIDPSWKQYIASEFRGFFAASEDVAGAIQLQPSDFPLVEEIYRRLTEGRESPEAIRTSLWQRTRQQRVIAVTSGKGGVGKTTVSVNLALALVQNGSRVLLVDADLGMANVHVYAGIQPRGTLLDIVEGTKSLADAVTPGPGGLHILAGQSGVARAADLNPRWVELLGTELRRTGADYDVILFDTGAGISAQVMSFLSLADEIVVIATPNLASTLDAYGLVKVAREMQLAGHIHLLVNHAESAEQAEGVFARLEACARQFLRYEPTRLSALPRDPAVEAAGQARQPLLLGAHGQVHAARFLEMARRLHSPRENEPSCSAAA